MAENLPATRVSPARGHRFPDWTVGGATFLIGPRRRTPTAGDLAARAPGNAPAQIQTARSSSTVSPSDEPPDQLDQLDQLDER
jgi:hypothetical protein